MVSASSCESRRTLNWFTKFLQNHTKSQFLNRFRLRSGFFKCAIVINLIEWTLDTFDQIISHLFKESVLKQWFNQCFFSPFLLEPYRKCTSFWWVIKCVLVYMQNKVYRILAQNRLKSCLIICALILMRSISMGTIWVSHIL